MTTHSKADFTTLGFNNRTSSTATRHYGNRERIFAQGDAATSIFCVKQGHVKLTITSPRRRDAAIAILSAGDLRASLSCRDLFRQINDPLVRRSKNLISSDVAIETYPDQLEPRNHDEVTPIFGSENDETLTASHRKRLG
jgi:hypothetical protein